MLFQHTLGILNDNWPDPLKIWQQTCSSYVPLLTCKMYFVLFDTLWACLSKSDNAHPKFDYKFATVVVLLFMWSFYLYLWAHLLLKYSKNLLFWYTLDLQGNIWTRPSKIRQILCRPHWTLTACQKPKLSLDIP